MIRKTAALATLALALPIFLAGPAEAAKATAKPCRADSWYWTGYVAKGKPLAVKRAGKRAGQPRPHVTAHYPIKGEWQPITGKACDRALKALAK